MRKEMSLKGFDWKGLRRKKKSNLDEEVKSRVEWDQRWVRSALSWESGWFLSPGCGEHLAWAPCGTRAVMAPAWCLCPAWWVCAPHFSPWGAEPAMWKCWDVSPSQGHCFVPAQGVLSSRMCVLFSLSMGCPVCPARDVFTAGEAGRICFHHHFFFFLIFSRNWRIWPAFTIASFFSSSFPGTEGSDQLSPSLFSPSSFPGIEGSDRFSLLLFLISLRNWRIWPTLTITFLHLSQELKDLTNFHHPFSLPQLCQEFPAELRLPMRSHHNPCLLFPCRIWSEGISCITKGV